MLIGVKVISTIFTFSQWKHGVLFDEHVNVHKFYKRIWYGNFLVLNNLEMMRLSFEKMQDAFHGWNEFNKCYLKTASVRSSLMTSAKMFQIMQICIAFLLPRLFVQYDRSSTEKLPTKSLVERNEFKTVDAIMHEHSFISIDSKKYLRCRFALYRAK